MLGSIVGFCVCLRFGLWFFLFGILSRRLIRGLKEAPYCLPFDKSLLNISKHLHINVLFKAMLHGNICFFIIFTIIVFLGYV
jgi:hypothetical protein